MSRTNDFPLPFLRLLGRELHVLDRVRFLKVSKNWLAANKYFVSQNFFVKKLSIWEDFVTFDIGSDELFGENDLKQISFSIASNCKRTSYYAFESLKLFVYNIKYIQIVYIYNIFYNNNNSNSLEKLYSLFKQCCRHWKCFAIVPSTITEPVCRIMELLASSVTMLSIRKDNEFIVNKSNRLGMLGGFLCNANSLKVLTVPIELVNDSTRNMVISSNFKKFGVLTIRITDEFGYSEPQDWINIYVAELMNTVEYCINIDISKEIIFINTIQQLNMVMDKYIKELERILNIILVGNEPAAAFIGTRPAADIIIRFEGSAALRGRYYFDVAAMTSSTVCALITCAAVIPNGMD